MRNLRCRLGLQCMIRSVPCRGGGVCLYVVEMPSCINYTLSAAFHYKAGRLRNSLSPVSVFDAFELGPVHLRSREDAFEDRSPSVRFRPLLLPPFESGALSSCT